MLNFAENLEAWGKADLQQARFFLKQLPYTLSLSHVTSWWAKKDSIEEQALLQQQWVFVEPTPFPNEKLRPKKKVSLTWEGHHKYILLDFNQCDLPGAYGSFQEHSEHSCTLNLEFSKPLHRREKTLVKIFWLKSLAFHTSKYSCYVNSWSYLSKQPCRKQAAS